VSEISLPLEECSACEKLVSTFELVRCECGDYALCPPCFNHQNVPYRHLKGFCIPEDEYE
jgi:hypothetical protein